MKSASSILLLASIVAFLTTSCGSHFKNGTYIGISQAQYTNEPYVGKVTITIKNDKIVKATFTIRDTLKNVDFNGDYEKYFAGNEEYMQQSRSDWKGVQAYPIKLVNAKKVEDVDAISGATWSYNIFKGAVEKALQSAINK